MDCSNCPNAHGSKARNASRRPTWSPASSAVSQSSRPLRPCATSSFSTRTVRSRTTRADGFHPPARTALTSRGDLKNSARRSGALLRSRTAPSFASSIYLFRAPAGARAIRHGTYRWRSTTAMVTRSCTDAASTVTEFASTFCPRCQSGRNGVSPYSARQSPATGAFFPTACPPPKRLPKSGSFKTNSGCRRRKIQNRNPGDANDTGSDRTATQRASRLHLLFPALARGIPT